MAFWIWIPVFGLLSRWWQDLLCRCSWGPGKRPENTGEHPTMCVFGKTAIVWFQSEARSCTKVGSTCSILGQSQNLTERDPGRGSALDQDHPELSNFSNMHPTPAHFYHAICCLLELIKIRTLISVQTAPAWSGQGMSNEHIGFGV